MTEFDIRELLNDYTDNSLRIQTKYIVSMTHIKEDVMNRIEKPSPRRRARRWPVLIAAVLCVALLTATAFAADIFKLGERQTSPAGLVPSGEYVPVTGSESAGASTRPSVTATGYVNSNEYLAALEWEQYVESSVADGTNLLREEEAKAAQPDGYFWVHAYSPEARAALDEILEKYDLALPSYERDITGKGLYDLTGETNILPLDADQAFSSASGRYFEGGALQIVHQASLGDGLTVSYDLYRSVKGWFSRAVQIATDTDTMEEWTYTTQKGTSVTLDLGADQSVLMAELENSFVYIHIRSGSQNMTPDRSSYNCPTVDRAALEAFADSIDFAALDRIT